MKRAITILLILFAGLSQSKGQEFTVMFYNVENLFDTSDDTTRDDDEFLPEGSRRWTEKRYWQKINALSRVIAAAGGWDLPALVGLCEVENEDVVKDLVYGSILSGGGYGVAHRESPDSRGIDPALLYRRDLIKIVDCRSWVPDINEDEVFESRNLLYVKALVDSDTLHIIICHWPSRRGGVLAAEGIRKKIAELVKVKEDSIQQASDNEASVIIMGDFNASPDDPVMSIITSGGRFMNPAEALTGKGKGSYRYQGKWELIDQIVVSESMTDATGSLYIDPYTFRVFDEPFLLADDPDYPGKKPFPTYGGFRWSGGYSDHLPVIITLKIR